MKKALLSIFCLVMLNTVSGQDTETEQSAASNGTAREIPWYTGSVILSDGTDLTGLVRFNDWNGAVAHKDASGETRTFSARNVSAFGFYDEEEHGNRMFYTFEIEDFDDNLKRPYFFEVLREYSNFGILVKKDPADLVERERVYAIFVPGVVTSDLPVAFTKVVAERIETVYLMDAATGEIKPYIQCKTQQDEAVSLDNPDDARERSKMIDEGLLEKFVTKRFYRALVQYASDNKLKFRRKDDFLKIMEYYSKLIDSVSR